MASLGNETKPRERTHEDHLTNEKRREEKRKNRTSMKNATIIFELNNKT